MSKKPSKKAKKDQAEAKKEQGEEGQRPYSDVRNDREMVVEMNARWIKIPKINNSCARHEWG